MERAEVKHWPVPFGLRTHLDDRLDEGRVHVDAPVDAGRTGDIAERGDANDALDAARREITGPPLSPPHDMPGAATLENRPASIAVTWAVPLRRLPLAA